MTVSKDKCLEWLEAKRQAAVPKAIRCLELVPIGIADKDKGATASTGKDLRKLRLFIIVDLFAEGFNLPSSMEIKLNSLRLKLNLAYHFWKLTEHR